MLPAFCDVLKRLHSFKKTNVTVVASAPTHERIKVSCNHRKDKGASKKTKKGDYFITLEGLTNGFFHHASQKNIGTTRLKVESNCKQ